MRVIHVLQGLHAAGIEHLALQLIAHSPAGTQGVLLNLDPEAQDLRPAFQRCCEVGQLETILDRLSSYWTKRILRISAIRPHFRAYI